MEIRLLVRVGGTPGRPNGEDEGAIHLLGTEFPAQQMLQRTIPPHPQKPHKKHSERKGFLSALKSHFINR